MSPSTPRTPSVRTDDGKLIVEAPTAEEALELVAERLGTRAKIAGVERVRRGGVGGFFARELVQVTATGGGTTTQERIEVPASTDGGTDTHAGGPVDRLLRELANRDDPFATALHDRLSTPAQSAGPEPARATGPGPAQTATPASDGNSATTGTPAPAPATNPAPSSASGYVAASQPARAVPAQLLPATRAEAPRPSIRRRPTPDRDEPVIVDAASEVLPGTPQWSVRNLCRLGLPPLLSANEATRLASADDIAWTHAVADSLRPLCRPLPTGPTVVVGPAAERLAGALELPIHWPGQQVPPESFIAPISGRYSEREWLTQVRGRRHLHLVVGGPAWRGLLFDDPVVLSYDDANLCAAVTLAIHLDIGLGYTCDASGQVTRANPIDLAMAIRRLLPVHP